MATSVDTTEENKLNARKNDMRVKNIDSAIYFTYQLAKHVEQDLGIVGRHPEHPGVKLKPLMPYEDAMWVIVDRLDELCKRKKEYEKAREVIYTHYNESKDLVYLVYAEEMAVEPVRIAAIELIKSTQVLMTSLSESLAPSWGQRAAHFLTILQCEPQIEAAPDVIEPFMPRLVAGEPAARRLNKKGHNFGVIQGWKTYDSLRP